MQRGTGYGKAESTEQPNTAIVALNNRQLISTTSDCSGLHVQIIPGWERLGGASTPGLRAAILGAGEASRIRVDRTVRGVNSWLQ